jgi:small subunit ribosomal protein S20
MAKEADKKKEKKEKKPQALKRDIQSKKRRLRNREFKSQVRSAIRKFEEAIPKEDSKEVKHSLSEVYSLMDKGVKKGVFKLNKASRIKGRLAARAAVKPTAS